MHDNAALKAPTETLVQSDVSSRVALAFRANASAIQRLLPIPWGLNPVGDGPSQEANFFLVFTDRVINLDADGKPLAGGADRFVVFAAPARNPESDTSGVFTFRIFTPNIQFIPGPYKNSELAAVVRELSYAAADMAPGECEEKWVTRAGDHADVLLHLRYTKAVPARAQVVQFIYSAAEPSFYRIYRVDQGTDFVKSKPAKIDRVLQFELKTDVPEFNSVFDGTEELISVAVQPWYVRRVFLP